MDVHMGDMFYMDPPEELTPEARRRMIASRSAFYERMIREGKMKPITEVDWLFPERMLPPPDHDFEMRPYGEPRV